MTKIFVKSGEFKEKTNNKKKLVYKYFYCRIIIKDVLLLYKRDQA